MSAAELGLIGVAGLVAGIVNAVAGGGSLISFPVLLATGVPAVTANMTNTVALCPGYIAGTLTQRRDLGGQGQRVRWLVPAALVGSVAGAWILMSTTERAFQMIVPVLLVFAAGLLAAQKRLRTYVAARSVTRHSVVLGMVPIALAAVYGAYFGAGLGVITLAVLAVVVDDTLLRLNALKQLLSFAINMCAAVWYVAVGTIDWTPAVALAVGSLVGGAIGGRLAAKVPEVYLRWFAIVVALCVAVIFAARA